MAEMWETQKNTRKHINKKISVENTWRNLEMPGRVE